MLEEVAGQGAVCVASERLVEYVGCPHLGTPDPAYRIHPAKDDARALLAIKEARDEISGFAAVATGQRADDLFVLREQLDDAIAYLERNP